MERYTKASAIGKKRIASSKKIIEGRHIPHFHEFYEIEYVIRGSGTYEVNGESAPCTGGMLFFMTPVDHHSVQTEQAEIFNVMFSEQLVEFEQLEPFLREAAPKVFSIEPTLRPFFELMLDEIVNNEDKEEYAATLMRCLLLKLAGLLPEQNGGRVSGTTARIQSYIIQHYRQHITLESVSKAVGLTPSYVSALFKKEMCVGFKTYLNSLRMEYAGKLAQYTEQPVKQIGAECGFEDIPNFIRRFKAYYGMTPTAMRDKQE